MKKYFILFFLIFFLFIINSDEFINGNKENKKITAFEFSIGGGFCDQYESLLVLSTNNVPLRYYENQGYYWSLSPSRAIEANLPLSITFYLNNSYGIGINTSFGINNVFVYAIYPSSPELFFKLKMINKFGKINNRYFLFEAGVSIMSIFFSQLIPVEIDNILFLIGPSFLFGFEKKFKNSSLIIGWNIDLNFNYDKNPDMLFFNIQSGPEIRYLFSTLNYVK